MSGAKYIGILSFGSSRRYCTCYARPYRGCVFAGYMFVISRSKVTMLQNQETEKEIETLEIGSSS